MPTRQQAEQFERDGYFIADDAVDPAMFDELAAAARRVKRKVRTGQVDVFTTGPPTRRPSRGRSAACSRPSSTSRFSPST